MRHLQFVERPLRSFAANAFKAVLAVAAVTLSHVAAQAQLPQIRLYSVFPPGAKAGTSLDVTVAGGADLDEVDAMTFSHPGIKASQKKAGVNTFAVTVDKSVPPGLYEARVGGLFGLSNPRTFVVGTRDEILETEPNNSTDKATAVAINQVVNGRSNSATDIDYFKFSGKKGQRVLAVLEAARIDSRLEARLEMFDAEGRRLSRGRNNIRHDPLVDVTLPADGDYFLKITDYVFRGGAEYFYRLTVTTGPHIDFIMPPSGLPNTKAKYTLYGRNLPGGQDAGVAIDGRPLQKLEVEIALPADATLQQPGENLRPIEADTDGISYVLQSAAGASNLKMIHFATAPVVLETEPNDEPAKSQKVAVPAEVVGQFQAKGDVDRIEFEAKAKEVFYIEVLGQRLGTNIDPQLTLEQVTKSDKGVESIKRITALDDNGANLVPLLFDTATDDPVYRFQAPADGSFRIVLRDRSFETRGSPQLVYRLSIRKPQPDFRLVVLPYQPTAKGPANASWAVGLRKGANVAVKVVVFRRDGFNEAIEVLADGLPKGVTCKSATIGSGLNAATLILTAAEDAPKWQGTIRVVGRKRVENTEKLKAAGDALTAVDKAAEAIARLDVAVAQTNAALAKANAAVIEVKQQAAKKKDDKSLANLTTDAQATAATAAGAVNAAAQAKAAGEKKLVELKAASKKAEAERQAAVTYITRTARPGTIVWGAAANIPSVSRVARSLALAVMKEQAPYQVTSGVFTIEVNQGRQMLIPIKLAKRTGFDADVTLTLSDLPGSSNIVVKNQPIKKGQSAQTVRLFFKNNARLGTYTAYWKTQGQVPYRRNIFILNRAKSEQAAAVKTAAEAVESAKKSVAARDTGKKKVDADAAALKAAGEKKTAAEKSVAAATAVAKAAVDEKPKTQKAAADNAFAEAKKAAERLAVLQKALNENKNGVEKTLEDALAESTQIAAALASARKSITDATTAADKKIADAQTALKKATAEKTTADKAMAAAADAAKASQAELAKAEELVKANEAKSKAATAAKQAADKKVAAADKATKAKATATFSPSTPVLITVKKSPITLAAAVPGGGSLKKGGKIDVKVTVKRINGFTGAITLELPMPPGVKGISASSVTIPPDKSDAVVSILASADATEGQLANMVVRGRMQFQGEAAVDIPITLKVAKPAPAKKETKKAAKKAAK